MANKQNVEINKKSAEIENKKSNELKQKKTKLKKKLRLHSHLKVNIPLFQSLMMILPSLAKHTAAEVVDKPNNETELAKTHNVSEKDVTDDHEKENSTEVTHQELQASENHAGSTQNGNQLPHGSNTHLVPSHHLSTLSHPQIHYIPSVSLPTISSAGSSQPTPSSTPPASASPVTFVPEVIKGTYGELHVDVNGHYTFVLNPNSPQYVLLNQHQIGTDHFALHLSNGSSIIVQIPIAGKQDTPSISGDLAGVVTEDHNIDSQGLLHANGKIDVIDPDQNESSVKPEVISGKYGSLTIDADGHWQYQVDNSLSNVQALTAATSLHESFTIHTKDGTPQTIDMTIGGNDDNAVIIGVDAGTVTEALATQAQGQLSVTDSDLGEDHFQASQINGHFGTLTIAKDGAWTYDLDNTNPTVHALGKGATATDTITVHSADGTPHQITITVNGTNNAAIITDTQTNLNARGVTEDRGYIDTHYQLHYDGKLNIQDPDTGEAQFDPNIGPQTHQGIGYDTKLGGHILLMRDGHYTYTLDNRNIQNLAAGETQKDSAVIRSADGTIHTIELTVHGTNDKPTIAAQSHTVIEGGTLLHGQMVGQDIDTGAQLHYSAPQIDGLTLNTDGSYSFDPSNASYQSLASGATKTLTIPVTVTDEHNASATQTLSITITGVNNSAVIGGVDTADINEGSAGQDMSPDYAQPGMAHLGKSPIYASGALTITDLDSGEATFDTKGIGYNYSGKYGDLLLQENGSWSYYADAGSVRGKGGYATNRGTEIDKLGEGDTVTDTITVFSKDGTSHDIVITIHGSNDRPYCASEVQLNSGKEDLAQTITATELLANTVDVDSNDTSKLTIANLHADHGSIQDNHDGTFTFTPSHNYNGSVHFTYDVKDAHGGTTHTGANTTLVATPDSAIISEVTTDHVTEDGSHRRHNAGVTTELANGRLQVVDPDSGEDKFQYSQFGETAVHDPFGGMLRIDSMGNWGYSVNNANLQHLAEGQTETVVYRVHSYDGTAYELHIDVIGTNDVPTVTQVALSNGTEDTHYQMQASQFGFHDIDTGDTLHSIAITDLPPATQGKFVLDGHDVTSGQQIPTADISKLQFVPAQDFNGDVQFKYTVNDGHTDSTEATNTLHIDAVGDKAVITGVDTGNVHEGHTFTAPDGSMTGGYVDDRSPDHMHGNIGKLWNDEIHTDGHLSIVDADAGESYAQTGVYYGSHGRVILQTNGDWSYFASIGQDVTGRAIDHLGKGESLTDTVTVKSADGTTHDIVITIHGDNDRPYCSGEVQLNNGKEDLAQTITASELLANTVDVDTNDIGKLTITNLHANHGSILDNQDGTFTFTPTKDYNGQVHFTYDVKDAHGGVTHTGASTTLSAVGDAATIAGIDTGSISENTAGVDMSPDYAQPGIATLGNKPLYADGKLTITDPDVGEAEFEHQGSNGYDYHGTYGDLVLLTDGTWHYHADAGHRALIGGTTTTRGTAIDQLGEGQSLTDTITIHSKDGTTHDIVITIHGSNDRPYCSSEVVLQSGSEDTRQTLTTAQLLANTVDVDKNDAGLLSIENLHADHGSILDNQDGTFTFTPTKDYNGQVHFTYDVKDAHGGVTHTGASTTLAAVDDKTMISGVDHGVATEDVATHMLTHVNIMDAVDWQALQITDVDSPNTQVTVEFAGKQYTWNIGSGLDVTTPYGKFQFHTIASGAHKGEHSWSYIGDNNNVHVQELKQGESLTESIKLIATDGTEFPITVKVNGTEDGAVIDSKSELGHVVENAQTGASVSGNVVAHDVDLHDTVSWTQTPTGGISGQYGTFHLSADGQWHYDVDQSKATKLGDGDEYWEHFTVEAVSTDGSHVSKSVSVVVHGNNDVPTVSGEVTLPSGKEDTSIHITQAELIANATDVDTSDKGWLHAQNLTADHGSLVSNSDGSFTFNPDPNYNGVVHFTYDVADRHGGIAHTGASTTLAAVNDVAVITGTGGHLLEEDNLYYGYTIKTNGQFHVVDPDGPSQSKFPDGLHHHTGSLGGTLQLYGNGNYFYHIDNSAVNYLAKGQEAKETFTIHSIDGTPHQVEFVIEGTNDAPFVHGDATLSPGTEDTTVTLHASDLLTQAGDYDDGETAQLSVHNLSADHGTVTDNKDGTYSFKPDANYNGTVHFTYDIQDPQGATVATSASMVLGAVADAPVLNVDIADTADNVLNVKESGAAAISGTLDPSVASTLDHIEITDGTTTVTVDKANITVATDGTYQTTADLTSLKDGALTVAAHATSHDGTTATSTDTIIKDTQVSVPTITFENAGADNLYSKAEIARGQANTITATVTPPVDAKIGEHLVVNGQDHVLDAHTLQHGIQIEVHPGSNVQATMTDEHGNTAGSQGFAASAIPEPIIVRPPSGSHQVSGTLGVPPLLPSLTPVPTAQSGWRIHLPNGQYVTSHHGQYGTLTIDPQTGHLHYQEQAQVHTGPHGSASGIGQHEDKFEVALQGTNQDEVVAHVNVQILSHGPGHSGKLTIGTEVVDMTITPVVHASHPAPPPPPPVQHNEPDMASQADFTVTLSDDSNLDLTLQTHQEPDQKTSHHGAAAYLDALGIKPDSTSTTAHDQPADMDIVLAQVDQPDAVTHDQAHLDMSDALEHHDANINHNQDDEHHHHNDVDGLPDIDPNS